MNLLPTYQIQGNKPVNVYQWDNKHVIEWLKEHDLQEYISIFQLQKVNGEQLLQTTEDRAIHEFKIEDDDDRKNFMQELDVLKENHDRRKKANMIEEAEKLEKEQSQYLDSIYQMPININGFNGRGQSNIEFDFDIGSTIQQFEDNNSVTNNNLLEKDIQILWLILNQSGGERMLNSNDYSMKQLLTDSRPTVFSHQNLVISNTFIQQGQASSTDYQSQQINELVASKMKVPLFPIFSKDHNFEQSERISEAQSYQENFSTLQITQEEKLQSILSQSLIIKDSLDLEKPEYVQFYELLSSEIQVVNEGIINQSQSNPISKKKIGVFRFTLAQKNSKQELSLTKQQTINLDNNLNSNWIFRSLNSSQIVALQVIKRAITIDDTYIIGNHIINIKSVEILTPDSCKITLNISRVNNQAAFKKLAVSVNTEGITLGKNKKICTIPLENDKEVSSNHCRLIFDPVAKCTFIIDNSSTNGTWIQIKNGRSESLGQKMHIQIDLKRDIMIHDCIENSNLDYIRQELQNNCIACDKNLKNTRNLVTQKIDFCSACAPLQLRQDQWAQILY